MSAEDLLEGVAALSEPPLIVVDALDEAPGHVDITVVLLLPFVRAHRADGRPCCRLLVGTRPWWDELGMLRDEALRHGSLIDLDDVEPTVLRQDLAVYLEGLLADADRYRPATSRALRRDIANRTAATLVSSKERGEFLKASLYTRFLAEHGPTDRNELQHGLATIPRTLPHVLELQLSVEEDRWVRPVLTAIAHAQGEGVPGTLAQALAAQFQAASNGEALDDDKFNHVLGRVMFYLRTAVDPTHGTTLYRLFHQELADYLQRFPPTATARTAHNDL